MGEAMRRFSSRCQPGRPRQAVTLVELMVFAFIGLMVAASAWLFLQSSLRRGASADKKFAGVESGLLFAIQLERDLQALYEGDDHPPVATITEKGSELRFYRYTGRRADENWEELEVAPVVYQFSMETARVTRAFAGEDPRVLPGYFERINFRLASGNPGSTGDVLDEAPAVIYSVTATPWEVLVRPPEQRKGSDRTVLVGGVSREQKARRTEYPFWNPVPYGTGIRVKE